MRSTILSAIVTLSGLILFVSCSKSMEEMAPAPAQVTFDIGMSTATRAAQAINLNTYSAKVYIFKEETAGNGRFIYNSEQNITSSSQSITGLLTGTKYKLVFLAIPKKQTPALPDYTSTKPNYLDASATYISGNQTANELFRNILTVTPISGSNQYSVVLTRQNGAIQIRLNNEKGSIKTVKLEVMGLPKVLFNDATGGMVLTSGTAITLSKSAQLSKTEDYRITIYLLPVEDLSRKGRITLSASNGKQTVYTLTSSSGYIPIYPNQITWLTLPHTCSDESSNSEETSVRECKVNGQIHFYGPEWSVME